MRQQIVDMTAAAIQSAAAARCMPPQRDHRSGVHSNCGATARVLMLSHGPPDLCSVLYSSGGGEISSSQGFVSPVSPFSAGTGTTGGAGGKGKGAAAAAEGASHCIIA